MIDWSKVVTVESKATADLAALKKSIAAARYEHEISGIVVSGMEVDTGRDSQGLIAGACLAAVIDPNYVVNWKCAEGIFLPLTATQIIGVATAVRAHVQACFDRESVLLSAVADESYTPEMLTQGWPTNE